MTGLFYYFCSSLFFEVDVKSGRVCAGEGSFCRKLLLRRLGSAYVWLFSDLILGVWGGYCGAESLERLIY